MLDIRYILIKQTETSLNQHFHHINILPYYYFLHLIITDWCEETKKSQSGLFWGLVREMRKEPYLVNDFNEGPWFKPADQFKYLQCLQRHIHVL